MDCNLSIGIVIGHALLVPDSKPFICCLAHHIDNIGIVVVISSQQYPYQHKYQFQLIISNHG